MRIALVVSGGVDPSGRERVIPALLWLIQRLARRHDVVVYVVGRQDQPTTYALLGATVCDLGRPRGWTRKYFALVAALRRDSPFDVIHGYWALPAGLTAAAAARRLGIPSVVTLDSGELVALRDIGYGLQQSRRQRLAVTVATRLANRITVCSAHMERLARARGIAPRVIPLGVDTDLFTPSHIPDGPPWRILQVASLNRVKNQRTLLEGLRHLIDAVPQIHLDIVGEDTLGGEIHGLSRQLKLDPYVTFHGHQPSDALVPLYRRAHLAVLSSRHEAAGVVTLEAAACGVATVGSRVGYVADWEPDRAVAVAPRDARGLADAIAALLTDPLRRSRIAAAAREWALAHNADWTAEQFERLYREIAGPSRLGPSGIV